MKDEHDKVTADAWEDAQKYGGTQDPAVVSGRRFKGSVTPDVARQCWATPQWIIDFVAAKFGQIGIDVCASPENAKAPVYFTEATNGLDSAHNWGDEGGIAWCNPPYEDPLPWVEKAIEQAKQRGVTTIMLVNNDPSTAWFLKALQGAQTVINFIGYTDKATGKFKSGRVAFVDARTGEEGSKNPKGSVIFEIKPKKRGGIKTEYLSRLDMETIGAKLL